MIINSAQIPSSLQYSSVPTAEENKAKPENFEIPTKEAVAPTEGVKVTLSVEGQKMSSTSREANPNKDIEESGLPDEAQKILKMIREIQQKIEEKQQELQALMADQTISQKVKQSRAGALQSTIATLTANLISANNALDKLSKNGTLSSAQSQQAAQLAMKK